MYRPLLLLTKGKLANKSQRIQGKEKVGESRGGRRKKEKKVEDKANFSGAFVIKRRGCNLGGLHWQCTTGRMIYHHEQEIASRGGSGLMGWLTLKSPVSGDFCSFYGQVLS